MEIYISKLITNSWINMSNSDQNTCVETVPEMDDVFNQECLEEHNRLRSLHGCPPVELDDELAHRAQGHSNRMASKNLVHHCLAVGHGENLSMREGDQPTILTGQYVTLRWYSEINKFNFTQEHQSLSGNFSQIVWKNTRKVGFGRTIRNGGRSIYLAAYYVPTGNIVGQFLENVPPPLSGKIYEPTDAEKGW